MVRKNALGRGLGALIEDAELPRITISTINEIDIDMIEVNPFQPRKNFNEESLQELASSIREIGIIQPITVRKINEDKFQLITGERRYKAAILAGLSTIPAYIRTVANSLIAHPTLSLEELNEHLRLLGWESVELDDYTLQLILAIFESDSAYGPSKQLNRTLESQSHRNSLGKGDCYTA